MDIDQGVPPLMEQPAPPAGSSAAKPHRWLNWKVTGAFLATGFVAMFFLVSPRGKSEVESTASSTATVAVVKVGREDLAREVNVDAELRPYQDIDVRAKVAGFVQSITVDVGDRVQEGQLLAILEIPELKEEIDHAEAVEKRSEEEVKRARAAHAEVHLGYERLAAAAKAQPNLIAQQDIDTGAAKDQTAEYALSAAEQEVRVAHSDVMKLKAKLDYSRITAPFAGVIAKRYADQGDFIQGGTSPSTQAMPLVHLVQVDKLRLVIPVSVSDVPEIQVGYPVEVHVGATGKTLSLPVSRFSREMDTATRKMHTELEVPNADLSLIPGMYASVVFQFDRRAKALTIPVEAISQAVHPTAYVVNQKGEIEERQLSLGLETPEKREVLSGLNENELVMIGNRSQVKPGQKVQPRPAEIAALK
jgi:RND family efflux transporter MFP subunit